MEKLFIYGTLGDPSIQQRVFGRTIRGQAAVLEGFYKDSITLDGATYPFIKPDPTGTVAGFVLEVTTEELERADVYETDAYRRLLVTLRDGQQAWVYCE